jgi:hypothetical protein
VESSHPGHSGFLSSSHSPWMMTTSHNTTTHVYVLYPVIHLLRFSWHRLQNSEKTLIMAMKQKSLDLHTKFEIIQECEVGSLSRSEIGTPCGLNSPVLFAIWNKRKFGIY